LALDVASLQPGLSRAERAQLAELLRDAARSLLASQDAEAGDPEIASVLSRHDTIPARETADAEPARQAAAEPDAGEAPADDWEALAEAAAAQRRQRADQRRAASAHKRRAQAQRDATQSLRDVYRKLASALHPDREPDAQQRLRKTALMQQANQAYAQDNLLALLELQAQALQADAARLATLDDQRLQPFLVALQEQLDALRSATQRLEDAFREATGAGPGSGMRPAKADRLASSEAQRLRGELALLRRQCRTLADVEATKAWLRAVRQA
jgi:hypothetical protein